MLAPEGTSNLCEVNLKLLNVESAQLRKDTYCTINTGLLVVWL